MGFSFAPSDTPHHALSHSPTLRYAPSPLLLAKVTYAHQQSQLVPEQNAKPVVSVLMAVWRADPGHFREAVQSIVSQTLTDWELIVVEDPSETPMADLLGQFDDERIRYTLNKARTNIVDQLNQGLATCRADLVARFDADDVCDPKRLKRQVEYLDSHPDVCVLGSQLCVVDGGGETLGFRRYPTDHDQILQQLPSSNPLAHPSVMFRRKDILDSGGYRGVMKRGHFLPWCQDYELWSRLALSGFRLANHPDALVSYRLHDDQIKSRHVREVLDAVWQIKQSYWKKNMTWRTYMRMWAERLLRIMPAKLCLMVFERLQVNRTLKDPR